MIEQRTILGHDDRLALKNLLEACNLAEGLELPISIPECGPTSDGDMAPLIWTDCGRIVGYLRLEGWPIPEGTPLTHPGYRRQGIGLALVREAADACRRQGLRRWLMVGDALSAGAGRFALEVGGTYDSSEFRMDLPVDTMLEPTAMRDLNGLKLTEEEGCCAHFARTLAEAFDDPLDQVERWVSQQAVHGDVRLLVAWLDNRPVGTLRLAWDGSQAWLTAVSVLPLYRKRGIGRWIVLSGASLLRDMGWDRIRIEVETTNEGARKLYFDCGFRIARTHTIYEMVTGK